MYLHCHVVLYLFEVELTDHPPYAKKAFTFAQKALSIDETDPMAHATLGWVYLLMRKYEKAIESGNRSVKLAPNGAIFNFLLGGTLGFADQVDEGIVYLKKAIRLNPFPAYFYYAHLGRCYMLKGQYEDAVAEYNKALQLTPNSPSVQSGLAITLIFLDREEEARVSAAKALELMPKLSVTLASKLLKYKNQDTTKRILDALRKAGFPE